jgi:type II secretory pathway component GspD/PulD (secretin)
MRLIAELDSQPPQVVIQVLIAEVDLNNEEEFGVEIGLQNPVLFRRSVGVTTINSVINGAGFAPGFNFNNPNVPLPNNFAADPSIVGFQSLGNFGTGRVSPNNGIGGFVFSAASDTFNLLIRALKVQGRIDILSRPQITCLDNQQAYLTVGQQIPIFTGTVATVGVAQSNVSQINVGVNMTVVPRINPDNTVIMRVVPEISSVLSQMVPLGNNQFGTSLNYQHLETTVLAADGETVVIGGLISKRDEKHENKIPWVGDLPYVGALFRFRTQNKMKTELLVFMTPHVVRSRLEGDRILAEEARRLDWVLGDAVKIHGRSALEPILPPPPGPRGAGLGDGVPNPGLWPGISCPPSPLPGAPQNAPETHETLPSPRTVPGSQSQAPTGTNALQTAGSWAAQPPADNGSGAPVGSTKEKRGWNLFPGKP